MRNKILVVGAGITGVTLAERFASAGNKVLLVEQRSHIGGNCYDYKDRNGILIHKYGPHIFHTNYKEVWDYLSQFTDWIYYQHRVLGFIDGKFVPIPFNLNTLYELLPLKLAEKLEEKLVSTFGYNKKISILELKEAKYKDLKFLGDFVYEKVFLQYSQKQWGIKLEEMDSLVINRVPIIISRDNRYFHDKYQGLPECGFTKMFESMTKNKNIEIKLNCDFKEVNNKIRYDIIIYTGAIDEFFNYKFGKLNYRYLKIDFKTLKQKEYQPAAVVNYTNDYDFTRITEFKKFSREDFDSKGISRTVIGIEYPGIEGFIAWPLLDDKNKGIFKRYNEEVEKLKKENVYFVGRLAEYKYYDMDDAIKNALDIFERIFYGEKY